MSNKLISREPQTVDENTWFYENLRDIDVCRKTAAGNTVVFKIPWSKLEQSLGRVKEERKRLKAARERRARK